MPKFEFDITRWPFVVITTKANYNMDDFEDYQKRFWEFLDAERSYGVLQDWRHVEAPNSKMRRLASENLVANQIRAGQLIRGDAFVISSRLMRGAVTA